VLLRACLSLDPSAFGEFNQFHGLKKPESSFPQTIFFSGFGLALSGSVSPAKFTELLQSGHSLVTVFLHSCTRLTLVFEMLAIDGANLWHLQT
jgi:hypothetical protein